MSFRLKLLIYGLFLVSGATGLVYQVAWTRDLSLVFGASYQAIAIVLAAFMAGLAFGGFYFGRRSQERARPLRLYALLELGVAIAALLTPVLFRLFDALYLSAASRLDGAGWTLNAVRSFLAFAALVVPTFFMGGTLPVLVRSTVQRFGEFGTRLAGLYAINTAGAVLGVLATFVLLPHFGVQRTVWIAVAANALVGAVALAADRRLGQRSDGAAARAVSVPPPRPATTRAVLPTEAVWALRLTFAGAALGGLCSLGLEVMWSRAISLCSGTTVYSFGVMLIAFLCGIALGSWVHAMLPLRRVHESLQFGAVTVLAGLASAAVSQAIPRLPELAVVWNQRIYGTQPAVGPRTTLGLAFAIMLLPCLCMGMAFPLAGTARARLRAAFGQSVGETVGINTLAAVLGSLLAGFVLIPTVGLQRGMLILSGLYVAYGAFVLAAMAASRQGLVRRLAPLVAVAGLALAAAIPLRAGGWDLHVLGTFRNNNLIGYIDARGGVALREELAQTALLRYQEGRASIVSVYERGDRRSLVINGRTVAGDVLTDLHHEMLLGHLPVLLHPRPRSAIVVGLGAGITLGGVTAHPGLEKIVLVEIEPAVFGGAELFADVNGDALHDPRLKVVDQDGRNYLLTSREQFDVVTADPIHPWAQGSAYLYTTEYYRTIRRRLAPGGIMCQWVPLYDLSMDDLRSISASFCENFEHTMLWLNTFDAILIGSNAPIQVDLEDWARRMAVPSVERQLSRIGLEKPLSMLAEFCMDDAALRRFSRGGVINTDDNLHIEFSSPLSLRKVDWLPNVEGVNAYRVSPRSVLKRIPPPFLTEAAFERTMQRYLRAKIETLNAAILTFSGKPEDASLAASRVESVLDSLPDYGLARRYLSSARTQLAGSLAGAGRNEEAIVACKQALAACPDDAEAHRVLGQALLQLGRADEAVAAYLESVRLRPRHAATRGELAVALGRVGRDAEAVQLLRDGLVLYPRHVELTTRLAWLLATSANDGVRDGAEAVRLAKRALTLPLPSGEEAYTLAALAAGLAETGRLNEALSTARKALRLAEARGQQGLVGLLRDSVNAYQAGHPLHAG